MQLSVVIVNYKVPYFLQQCLLSVQEALHSLDGEIIVVDNHSSDRSCSMVKTHFPEVVLIENKENVGFSRANNQGVQQAKGDYVLILNPDTVVAEETFIKILDFAQKQENLGALGVKLVDGTGKYLPESKRNLPTPKVAFKKIIGLLNTTDKNYYANHLSEDEVGVVDVLVGAFMLIKRERYLEVGGFDEDYFMFGEDIDLSYKLHKRAYQNYYFPQIQIIHYKGESTSKDARYLANFYGAMRIFYSKHFKVNPLIDFMMNGSIYFWQIIKSIQLHTTNKAKEKTPRNLLYVGNENTIFEGLQEQYKSSKIHIFSVCSTRVISRYDDLDTLLKIIDEKHIDEIVFDQQSTTFSKIIFYMTALKDRKISFKIRPKKTHFIIGSNDSNKKGAVVVLHSVQKD